MPDGRLYLYGSNDISGEKSYCSREYRVFSTDDPKLEKWVDHGVSFSNYSDAPGIPWAPDVMLYAPDAIHRDGKYYLYICGANHFEAVAVSDTPYGPFADAVPIEGATGTGIDPAVFIDDDGQAYYFWGQFSLMGAKLDADMSTLDRDCIRSAILTEQEHGFHEGASIRKRGGKYYLVYTDISRGRATCMSYAVADAPLGPYKKGGVIIDNTYCDPETWNDHGSIAEFKGQWYVFYHRSSQNGRTSRRMCAEPIYFNDDGSINEVIMTSQGASGPIDAFSDVDASVACRVKGNVYIAPDECSPGNEVLKNCGGGNWKEDWAEYRYLDLGAGASSWRVRASGTGKISVMVGGFGVAGSIEISSEGFRDYCGSLEKPVSGIAPVWIIFDGNGISMDSFSFGA